MKAMKPGKFLKTMKAALKAKKNKVLFLKAFAVVGEWARNRVCRLHGLEDEWDRHIFLILE